jgi:hypothetical protein
MSTNTDLQPLIDAFTAQITAVVERATSDRLRAVVAGALGARTRFPRKTTPTSNLPAAPPRRPASLKMARARRLQGRYLGLLKGLKGDDRSRVKAVASEKGVAAALKLGRSVGRGKAA